MAIIFPASLRFDTVAAIFRDNQHEHSGIIDLSQVEDCDSAGIALLVNIIGRLRRMGVPVQVLGVSATVRQLMHFYELDFLIPQQEGVQHYDK